MVETERRCLAVAAVAAAAAAAAVAAAVAAAAAGAEAGPREHGYYLREYGSGCSYELEHCRAPQALPYRACTQ